MAADARSGGKVRTTVVFDLGGVLISWNPRNLYRKLFPGDDAAMEQFLGTICTQDWNERQDAGRSFAEAEAELIALHPSKAELIRAFGSRFDEMIPGALDDVVAILAELKQRRVPLFALSNWSAETFPPQRRRFPFLGWFEGIVVSGEEGVIKPDQRIFERLVQRYRVRPETAVFIDDNPGNAEASARLGFHGIHFTSATALRTELASLGLLPSAGHAAAS
ncbi:MAG: HAD family phosphatase [Alphaproteobacteria bacterium]|nr:HAD family phosphatase [Alphaproteobacteria bacterium]